MGTSDYLSAPDTLAIRSKQNAKAARLGLAFRLPTDTDHYTPGPGKAMTVLGRRAGNGDTLINPAVSLEFTPNPRKRRNIEGPHKN